MKKIFKTAIILVMVCCIALCSMGSTGCDGENASSEEQAEQIPITCTINFAKTVNERYEAIEMYDEFKFKINTKVYVIVDFTMINYRDYDDIVYFNVIIPNADYYSTHDYQRGPVIPAEDKILHTNDDGITTEAIWIHDMPIPIEKGQIPFKYTYCFCIAGNKASDDLDIEIEFESKRNLIEKGDKRKFEEKYAFVE